MANGLNVRPSAATFEVEDLVQEAWKGHIRIPHFQRAFRWNARDVLRLFDSIDKGYPIGSLLLWVKPAGKQEIRLGALSVSAPKTDSALWVVDGQQRITSLASALHPKAAQDERFALSYHLAQRAFVLGIDESSAEQIPLPIIFDLQSLVRWLAEHPEAQPHFDTATAVAKRLRQFPVPAYQVTEGSEEVLTDIFDRMNNFGKRLSRAEIFSALYAQTGTGGSDSLSIEFIAKELDEELAFGTIDQDTVLRAILARRGPDVTREIRSEFSDHERRSNVEFPGERRDDAYEAGREALGLAISFLQNEAGVPHFTFLPYRYLLVVLTRFFAHFPDPGARNMQLLRRWYWRAALAGPGVFKGSATGAMRALCNRVVAADMNASVQQLLHTFPDSEPNLPNLGRFRTNEASTKIVLGAWWSKRPKSPVSGEAFDNTDLALSLLDRSTAADICPLIISRRAVPQGRGMWAANRLLLPGEEPWASEVDELLLRDSPLDMSPEAWRTVMHSHSLSTRMLDYLRVGEISDFLDERQAVLYDELAGFLNRMCEWGYEDTPPLSEFVIEDLPEDMDDETYADEDFENA